MLNRWVLSRDWKTAMEGEEVTRSGRKCHYWVWFPTKLPRWREFLPGV